MNVITHFLMLFIACWIASMASSQCVWDEEELCAQVRAYTPEELNAYIGMNTAIGLMAGLMMGIVGWLYTWVSSGSPTSV